MSDSGRKQMSIEELAMLDEKDLKAEDLARLKKLQLQQSEMSDRLIANFENNLKAFEKYLPDIARTFKDYRPKRTLEFFCSENGIPNLLFTDSNDIFYKTDDPFAYCAKQVETALENNIFRIVKYEKEHDWCGQIHFRYLNEAVGVYSESERENLTPLSTMSMPNCVMLGIGLGYPLAELYARVEIVNLIAVEPDTDLFFASLHAFDWAHLLEYVHENNFGMYLMVGQTPEQLFDDMHQFYLNHGRFLSSFFWEFVHYQSETISKMKLELKKDYTRTFNAMGFFDDHMFGISHALYAVKNHKHFVSIPESAQKDSELFRLPVFIVGSGPSLDADIPFLRKNQDKALIIACGTALDSLYHAGIKPDFYACTERTPQIAQTLLNIPDRHFFDDIILLAADVVHPDTQDIFTNTAIFLKPDEPFYWMAVSRIPEAGFLNVAQLINPLVGNMGLSSALHMGFSNLYLFGLDNGRKVGQKQLHSQYTRLYQEHEVKDDRGAYKISDLTEGNFGGMCESGYFYKMSIRHMEILLNAFKDKAVCHNCSDGSRIEGTVPVHSETLDFESLSTLDKAEIHRFFIENYTREIQADSAALERVIGRNDFCSLINKFKEIWDTEAVSRIDFIKKMEGTSEILSYLQRTSDGRYKAYCLEGTVESLFITLLRSLYLNKDVSECLEMARKIVRIYLNFLEDAAKLYEYLPDYILGPHQKILSGRVGFDHEGSSAPAVPGIPSLRSRQGSYAREFVKRYE
ncbi:MAG TPA: hypothetical protein DCR21_03850 [Succinivibrionaceae bacterium]|nr:motility associated factor glycosyltransferase family protein [Succinivibrio sp.]HAR79944.1 hypothetical protein [Succinivibrionaceae bacterium]